MSIESDYLNLDAIAEAGHLLVTGTDTGIGKTWTTVKIIEEFKRNGKNISAVKPIETGCDKDESGELVGSDIEQISEALGLSREDPEYRNLFFKLYHSPVAPSVAVEREGSSWSWNNLVDWLNQTKVGKDNFLIEGAGGLLVPIVNGQTFAELAQEAGLKVLVVFGSRLGAINQAALTFEVLRSRGLPIAGYVFNQIAKPEEAAEGRVNADQTNRELLKKVASRYEVEEIGYLSWEGK